MNVTNFDLLKEAWETISQFVNDTDDFIRLNKIVFTFNKQILQVITSTLENPQFDNFVFIAIICNSGVSICGS